MRTYNEPRATLTAFVFVRTWYHLWVSTYDPAYRRGVVDSYSAALKAARGVARAGMDVVVAALQGFSRCGGLAEASVLVGDAWSAFQRSDPRMRDVLLTAAAVERRQGKYLNALNYIV